jgi:hypothetical protein
MGKAPTGDVQHAIGISRHELARVEAQIGAIAGVINEKLNALTFTADDEVAVDELQLRNAAYQRAYDRLSRRIRALEAKVNAATDGKVAGITG